MHLSLCIRRWAADGRAHKSIDLAMGGIDYALAWFLGLIRRNDMANLKVKALVFDTFGTVVDWRGSMIAEGMTWGKAKGLNIDWAKFTDAWHNAYPAAMD